MHFLSLIPFLLIYAFCALAQEGSPRFTSESMLDMPLTSMSAGEAERKIREAIEIKKAMTPTQDAEFYYEFETNERDRPCQHCPQYLGLIREVNKIVGKIPKDPRQSIGEQNESLIQLNRLKFLYYETLVTEENGKDKCQIYQHSNPFHPDAIPKESKILIAEEALRLSNVTTIQYLPTGKEKEVHYFYQGEGSQRDIIIEVVVYSNDHAVVRYHHYTPKDKGEIPNIPDLEGSQQITSVEKLTDGEKGYTQQVYVSEDFNISSDSRVKLNKQSTSIVVADAAGKNWIAMDAVHKIQGQIDFRTVIPVEWKIEDEGGLKLGGNIKYESTNSYVKGKDHDPSYNREVKTIDLFLTSHNREYLRAAVISNSEGTSYSVGHQVNTPGSSYITRVGLEKDRNKFVEFQNERRISETTSMVLTVKTSDGKNVSLVYQVRSDF